MIFLIYSIDIIGKFHFKFKKNVGLTKNSIQLTTSLCYTVVYWSKLRGHQMCHDVRRLVRSLLQSCLIKWRGVVCWGKTRQHLCCCGTYVFGCILPNKQGLLTTNVALRKMNWILNLLRIDHVVIFLTAISKLHSTLCFLLQIECNSSWQLFFFNMTKSHSPIKLTTNAHNRYNGWQILVEFILNKISSRLVVKLNTSSALVDVTLLCV